MPFCSANVGFIKRLIDQKTKIENMKMKEPTTSIQMGKRLMRNLQQRNKKKGRETVKNCFSLKKRTKKKIYFFFLSMNQLETLLYNCGIN